MKIRSTYNKLGRVAHRAITPFLNLYMTEKHVRVRVLVISDEQKVLLVKSWLGHQKWSLPGGGIRKSETVAEAAVRETHEETGLRIHVDELHELGTFVNDDTKAKFTIAAVLAEIAHRPTKLARHRRLEMVDVAWFPLNRLPPMHSATVDQAIELYKKR